MNLKEKRTQILAEARATVDKAKAAGRDLTPAEIKSVEDATAEAVKIGDQLEKVAESEALVAKLAAMGLQNRPFDPNDPHFPHWGVDGEGFARLRTGAKGIGRRLASQVPRDGGGRKALVAGGAVATGIEVDTVPLAIDRPATSLFDVLPTHVRAVPVYKYFRQQSRDNNAAVIPPGTTKPTSIYTIGLVDGALEVIGHLSEALDTYALGDDSALGAFIQAEMVYGLSLAVEAKVVADVLATSGIQTQAFLAADYYGTTRNAVTALTTVGITPGFWIINPLDWQKFELVKTTTGEFVFGGGGPIELAGKRLWSTPVVESLAVPAGTGYLYGQDAVVLSTDGTVSMRWYETGTDFEKNEVHARCESRFNTDVMKPAGVVKVALA